MKIIIKIINFLPFGYPIIFGKCLIIRKSSRAIYGDVGTTDAAVSPAGAHASHTHTHTKHGCSEQPVLHPIQAINRNHT